MSFVPYLSQPAIPATIRPSRKIGTIVATVTIEETGTDEATITQHPVQQGAAITDHAFANPSQLVVRAMWNDQTKPLSEIYQDVLTLRNKFEPMDVVTGKRIYKNMLIKGISQTTDAATDKALSLTITLQEIRIVQVTKTNVAPRARQAKAGSTGATEKAGSKKAEVVDESKDTKKSSALRVLAGKGERVRL